MCPLCKKGEMMERRGRFGIFYSCSNYRDCKNAIKAKPTGRICPECGSLMMEGTKTIPERCSSKACPNHNPHKTGEEPKKKEIKKRETSNSPPLSLVHTVFKPIKKTIHGQYIRDSQSV